MIIRREFFLWFYFANSLTALFEQFDDIIRGV